MSVKVVKLDKPPQSAELARFLEEMAKRARDGEFESVYAVFVGPDGCYRTIEKGDKIDHMRLIGFLESMKFDLLQAGVIRDL